MFNGRTILDNIISAAIGVLIIAYFYSRLTAPTPTEIATIQHPHELGFPKWFGSGPSPHDVRVRHVVNGFEEILVEYGELNELDATIILLTGCHIAIPISRWKRRHVPFDQVSQGLINFIPTVDNKSSRKVPGWTCT
jgi:hypothetical protein